MMDGYLVNEIARSRKSEGLLSKMMQDTNSSELVPLDAHQSNPKLSAPNLPATQTWRWREMITAAFIIVDFFFLYSSVSLIGVFFPAEAGDKGASVFVTGVIIGVTPLVVTVLAPIVGFLLPILRIPFSIVAGLILVGAAYIGLGIIEGIATALFTTAGYTLVTELYPDSTGFIVGITEVGCGVGYASGPVIGGFLYKAGGYKLPFFVVGGLCCLLSIPISLILLIVKSSQGESTRQLLHLEAVFNLFKNFIVILLVFDVIIQLAGLGFLNTAYSLFLGEQLGLTPDKIGLVFLALSVPYAISAPLSGKLADKTNPRILVICGLCLSGLGYILIGPISILPINPTLWLTICSQFMVGVGAGIVLVSTYPGVLSAVLSQSDSEQEKLMGVIAGVISAAMSFGEFLGPVVGGGLVDLTSFRSSSSIIGEVILALTILLLMVTILDHCLGRTKQLQDPECDINLSSTRPKSVK